MGIIYSLIRLSLIQYPLQTLSSAMESQPTCTIISPAHHSLSHNLKSLYQQGTEEGIYSKLQHRKPLLLLQMLKILLHFNSQVPSPSLNTLQMELWLSRLPQG